MRGLEVKARGRDLLAQSDCRLAREVPVAGRVELTQHLHTAGRGAPARVVGSGRVKPRPQKPRDLFAVEQLGRHALGFELCTQRVDVSELLAHRATVRAHRPLQRRGRQPAPLGPRQCGSGDALARHQRHDHIAGDLHRRLGVGVQAQRFLHPRVQPPARQRQPITIRCGGYRSGAGLHLPPAVRQQLREVHRPGVDVDLHGLLGAKLRDQSRERPGGLLPLARGHQQRVARRDPEDPHQRTLAGHDQPGPVDRLDREQVPRVRQAATTTHERVAVDHHIPFPLLANARGVLCSAAGSRTGASEPSRSSSHNNRSSSSRPSPPAGSPPARSASSR